MFTLTQACLPLLREAALIGGREGDVWRDPARVINVSPTLLCEAMYCCIEGESAKFV